MYMEYLRALLRISKGFGDILLGLYWIRVQGAVFVLTPKGFLRSTSVENCSGVFVGVSLRFNDALWGFHTPNPKP